MVTVWGSSVWCGLAVHLATSLSGPLLFPEPASPPYCFLTSPCHILLYLRLARLRDSWLPRTLMSTELKKGRDCEEVGSQPAWETWQSQEGSGKGLPEGKGERDGGRQGTEKEG